MPVNCRNTRAIAEECAQVIGRLVPIRDEAPAGSPPEKVTVDTADAQWKTADDQVRKWSAAGLKPRQIAVLTAGKPEAGCVHGRAKIGNLPITTELDAWRKDQGVLITSSRKFQVLEADAIVLTDVPPNYGPGYGKEHHYVACSRAKHLLTVVTSG